MFVRSHHSKALSRQDVVHHVFKIILTQLGNDAAPRLGRGINHDDCYYSVTLCHLIRTDGSTFLIGLFIESQPIVELKALPILVP